METQFDNAERVDYVLSVYDGMVVEVYKPVQWFEGLSTFTTKDDDKSQWTQPRYEFVGRIADSKIRKKYIGKSVAGYFSKGDQNPIRYIWGEIVVCPWWKILLINLLEHM